MLTPHTPYERLRPVGQPDPPDRGVVLVSNSVLPEFVMAQQFELLGFFIGTAALDKLVADDPKAAATQMNRWAALAHVGKIQEIGIVRCPVESKKLNKPFYGQYTGKRYPDGVSVYNPGSGNFEHVRRSWARSRLTRRIGAVTTSALRGYYAAQFLVNAAEFVEDSVAWNWYVDKFVPRALEPIQRAEQQVAVAA